MEEKRDQPHWGVLFDAIFIRLVAKDFDVFNRARHDGSRDFREGVEGRLFRRSRRVRQLEGVQRDVFLGVHQRAQGVERVRLSRSRRRYCAGKERRGAFTRSARRRLTPRFPLFMNVFFRSRFLARRHDRRVRFQVNHIRGGDLRLSLLAPRRTTFDRQHGRLRVGRWLIRRVRRRQEDGGRSRFGAQRLRRRPASRL